MIMIFVYAPIQPIFQHNTPRHIYFRDYQHKNKILNIFLIIIQYIPKEMLDSVLPTLSYVHGYEPVT